MAEMIIQQFPVQRGKVPQKANHQNLAENLKIRSFRSPSNFLGFYVGCCTQGIPLNECFWRNRYKKCKLCFLVCSVMSKYTQNLRVTVCYMCLRKRTGIKDAVNEKKLAETSFSSEQKNNDSLKQNPIAIHFSLNDVFYFAQEILIRIYD